METRKTFFEAAVLASIVIFCSCSQTNPQLSTTAVQLCNAYDSSVVAASSRFDNRTILLEGTVSETRTGEHSCYILLSGDAGDNGIDKQVICNFNDKQASMVANIGKNATVKIVGRVKEGHRYPGGDAVVLVDCRLFVDSGGVD